MPHKIPRLVWAVLPLAYVLYFHGLGSVGLLGKDEPRYASVAREMAWSGDWVTPRLWGQPWFEKPALTYWMGATGFRLGLSPDLAPRLPVAGLAVAFLGFYWWILAREFGCRAAWMATLILGTSGMWLGYSQVGVTDIPLTATFSAAMLLCLPWVGRADLRYLPAAAAMLGFAVLAKGLVPLALAVPLLWWFGLGRIGLARIGPGWIGPVRAGRPALRIPAVLRIAIPFLVVALPWYLLCYWRNGWPFIEDFILKQHFARITSPSLMHVQPWWFYWKWLPGELLPWTPLLLLLLRPRAYRDPRRQFLLALALFGMLLFSIPVNKLPGYILPVIPAIAALMGVALDEEADAVGHARSWLVGCGLVCAGLVLVAFPIAAAVLPEAMNRGLTRVARPAFQPEWLLAAAPALGAWLLEARGKRLAAVFTVAAGVAAGVFYLKATVVPELNQKVSARDLWGQVSSRAGEVCVEGLDSAWRYGLNYYSVTPLPECSDRPTAWRVRQEPGKPPHLDAGSPGAGASALTGARATVDPPSRHVVTSTLWK
ncbi:MAG TPA: glycosyltransferase family 39 protein [Candidatus Acidoferrales bacterium]|jgi:4-amino-4-deoxy-L-arabinose transferase-like glycosyltransferase|nr:glycosyltransferase family 39 protein [Candidatus Acidoferrales bacterium]